MGVEPGKERMTVFYPQGIEMHLTSQNTDLLEYIKGILPYFFALHAFGTRSSKGFGCYMVERARLDFQKLKSYTPLETFIQ